MVSGSVFAAALERHGFKVTTDEASVPRIPDPPAAIRDRSRARFVAR